MTDLAATDGSRLGGLPRTPPDVAPRVRRLVIALAIAGTVTGLIGTALSPYLLVEHPLWLIALNPDSRHLVLVANRVELWQAVLVGSLRRSFNFASTYGLAGLYGFVLITWLEKKRPWVKRVVALIERLYAYLGIWLVVLVPLYWVAVLSGIARIRPHKYCLAIIPGQIAFVLGTLWFGGAIEQWTEPVIAFLTAHLFESTAVCVALVALQQLWSRWRKKNRDPGEPELPF